MPACTFLVNLKNKLTVPCVGYDKGSFWYKCAPEIGYGSTGCDFAQGLSSMLSLLKILYLVLQKHLVQFLAP